MIFTILLIKWISFLLIGKLLVMLKKNVQTVKWKEFENQELLEENKPAPSIWRTLFIANEFNELSEYRLVSLEWTSIFYIFFMVGIRWDNQMTEMPQLEVVEIGSTQKNFILKFFFSTFLFYIIFLIQYFANLIKFLRVAKPSQDFCDLCSVANISILILDSDQHGYYVHGQSPLLKADGTAEHIKRALEFEARTGKPRGLDERMQREVQTYEIFIPQSLRTDYNNIFMDLNLINVLKEQNPVKKKFKSLEQLTPIEFNRIEKRKQNFSDQLKSLLLEVQKMFEAFKKEKTYFERFLGLPPCNYDQITDKPIFIPDPQQNFTKIFWQGNELNLMMIWIIIYQFYDIIFQNSTLATLLVYITVKFIFWANLQLQEANIGNKTLIDERFLI
eukprot:TRINITY_DN23239_c0_g1_i1.p1 TRINITY_DN23239_c0_g1~~TRINITY_DN23239_c0_g1_i1.p1  ORF type:complete len:389 (-),score=43.20 TRINITY_DN23239_c0_g1_i1:17-1183(-)